MKVVNLHALDQTTKTPYPPYPHENILNSRGLKKYSALDLFGVHFYSRDNGIIFHE